MKKEDIRIVFMGTPDFAVSSLELILKEGFKIVGVITAPDKQSGRGRKINESAVKKFALSHNLNILQPTNLKDVNFIAQLKELKPDIQVVVAFRMLPIAVWKLPKLGTFNLHASLLPQYRGAAPINHAIINGEKQTGITTFFLDEKIDTGKIINQIPIDIDIEDNAGSLHDKLMVEGAKLVVKTLYDIINSKVKAINQISSEQDNIELHKAPKIFKEDCQIDWNLTTEEIHNFIRGLSPYPGAFTFLKSDNSKPILVKIFKTSFELGNQSKTPGQILSDNKSYINAIVSDGIIHIEDLQLAGKKRMNTSEFLRGFNNVSEYIFC